MFAARSPYASLLLVACACVFLQPPAIFGQDPRGVAVEAVNDRPGFMVRVDVDRPHRTYEYGDVMYVTVKSEKAGHLYLFYCDANLKVSCLFPNVVQKDNRIPAGKTVVVPSRDATFRLRVGPPAGKEILKAVVTTEPLHALENKDLARGDVTQLDLADLKGVYVEVQDRDRQEQQKPKERRKWQWAEHHVDITTIDPAQPPPQQVQRQRQGKHRRVGVFVGVSQYESSNIRKLTVCHTDAKEMAQTFKDQCQVDEAIVLTNSDATLEKIETAIRKKAAESTVPGDTVVIYWSGHGGRCADDNGDEKDGYDEYLVPFDGELTSLSQIRGSMLLDDAFGRWIQELDGRKVVIILDTCHSGGQATHEKGVGVPAAGTAEFDFLDGELARAKDVGQKETALLTSSKASELSMERREGDLSVMTYFLTRQLRDGSGPLTLSQIHGQLKDSVPLYVEKNFPGATQTPVLADETTPPFYLRP